MRQRRAAIHRRRQRVATPRCAGNDQQRGETHETTHAQARTAGAPGPDGRARRGDARRNGHRKRRDPGPADEHAAAHHHGHAAGGFDAHRQGRHVDGQPDRLRLRLAALRRGRRELLAHQRRQREDVRPQAGRPGQHHSRGRDGAERRRPHDGDLGAERGDPRGAGPAGTTGCDQPGTGAIPVGELGRPNQLSIDRPVRRAAVVGGSTARSWRASACPPATASRSRERSSTSRRCRTTSSPCRPRARPVPTGGPSCG